MASWHWAQNFTLGIDSEDIKPHGSNFLSFTAMVLKEGQFITFLHRGQCLEAFLLATTWGRALVVERLGMLYNILQFSKKISSPKCHQCLRLRGLDVKEPCCIFFV